MNKRKFFKVWVAKPLVIILLVVLAMVIISGLLLLGKVTFNGMIAAADRQAAGEMQFIENHKADNRHNWNKE